LEEYEKLDKKYVGLVKKVAKLIKGFPTKLILADRKDGGLGVTSTLTAAMERKRKMMIEMVHRGGAVGIAMEGQISRLMRDAGQGGLGPCKRHLWTSLGTLATGLSSLVRFLKSIGLRIRVGYGEEDGWELACKMEQDVDKRTEMNRRGIVLESELHEGGNIPIRIGQCWEVEGRAIEILGFRGGDIEIMEWECGILVEVGKKMKVLEENRPKGIGGSTLMDRQRFVTGATHLVELGLDEVTEGGEGDLVCTTVARRRNKAIERRVKIPGYLSKEWAMWGGGIFTHIYTDGSYKEEADWGEYLLGDVRRQAGGAVILSDGKSWYHRIFVEIDMEVSDAGQVEVICLLLACEMAKAQGNEVIIGSDCENALKVVNGGDSEAFSHILGGWKKWDGITTKKIAAHPERFKPWQTWDDDDMGIYIADRVAGEFYKADRTVSAKEWMMRVAAQSKVSIELEDGTPFIGSISRRVSQETMKQYFMERDGYRELEGEFEPRWEGANMSKASTLLKRNGGFEDRVTMVKLAAGKRWDVSRHNKERCVLCQEEFSDQRHAMMDCIALEVHNAREAWKNGVKELIAKAEMGIRVDMEEYYRNVFSKPDGEMAAVGTFTRGWVARLNKERKLGLNEMKKMKELMLAIAQGARTVMRVYTRACCEQGRKSKIASGYVKPLELRQLSISEFMGQKPKDSVKIKNSEKKGKKRLPEGICTPPVGTLTEIERGGLGLARWER